VGGNKRFRKRNKHGQEAREKQDRQAQAGSEGSSQKVGRKAGDEEASQEGG
jgi:hypothetical protein